MNKALLDAMLARLASDFPDTAKTYSAEIFADWLANVCSQYMQAYNTPQRNSTIGNEFRRAGLSPTGRRPSQPALQDLPKPSTTLADFHRAKLAYRSAADMTEERAKELLQQYRDAHPSLSGSWGMHPGGVRNFPCVAVDLASGVDYSVEQRPMQVDHASVDDKGNVSVSVGYLMTEARASKTERVASLNPALAAPYGSWTQMSPDDIYKDISGMLLRKEAEELSTRQSVETTLRMGWTHVQAKGVIHAYVPAYGQEQAVLSIATFDAKGVCVIGDLHKGEEAVTLARAYLLRLVKLEPQA